MFERFYGRLMRGMRDKVWLIISGLIQELHNNTLCHRQMKTNVPARLAKMAVPAQMARTDLTAHAHKGTED